MMDNSDPSTSEEQEEICIDYGLKLRRALANPLQGEDVVITGISGTFPSSRNVHEFRDNLFNKSTMVTLTSRWDFKHPEIPPCSGEIPDVTKYDAGFFGIHRRQSDSLDSMSRVFQEKAIEALIDAGLHPSDLENTRTGVFVGTCFSESDKSWFFENLETQTFAFSGAERSMIAHRLSYFLKLKGPSYTTDTACSSSLYAFEHAYRALRLGEIDTAIIGGTNLCVHPFVSLQFARLGVLSKDGACKAFDKLGDGYTRSEAISAVILQRSKDANRVYAQVLHAKTNCDGYKEQGITYPSGEAQKELINEFYQECGVDRYSLSYLEAHGTGTFVGDPEECNAMDEVLTKHRKTPLLIGSVKSNIGHSEPASGLSSIVKVIIGMETGLIPPNINFNTPRDEIKGLQEGRMKVVSEKTPFQDDRGLMAINSFGFGGGNCHILLHWNDKLKVNSGLPNDSIPRLITVSGRTEEAVTCLLDESCRDKLDAEYVGLIHNVFRKTFHNHLYRGYSIISKSGEIIRSVKYSPETDNPLYFAFGELNNWHEIGNNLMIIPAFADSMKRIQKHLLSKKINIADVLHNKIPIKDNINILGSVAVQTGVIDMLKLLGVKPTGSFGYSFGELLAAYQDDVLTLEETIGCAAVMNEAVNVINDTNTFNNDNVINQKNNLKNGNGIMDSFHTVLENLRVALRTKGSIEIKEKLVQNLKNILGKPTTNGNGLKAQHRSAEYFLSALTDNFYKNIENIDIDSVILKIGSGSLRSDFKETIPLITPEGKNYAVEFLNSLGRLYEYGHSLKLAKLYPKVQFPVSRGTRMISPFIKWKHIRDFFLPQYNLEIQNKAVHGARNIKIQLSDHEWSFVSGHVIDGRNLFPATGYLILVWETLSIINTVPMSIMSLVFENCKFIRATTLPKKGYLLFRITIQKDSGEFEVMEGDSPVVTGRVYQVEQDDSKIDVSEPSRYNEFSMTTKDVYKELRLRGYNYKGDFRAIQEFDPSTSTGFVKWDDNWVAFMDNMLQLKILQTDTRLLYVPTFIAKLCINAKKHLEWVNKSYITVEKLPILPIKNNEVTGIISCGAIQLWGLIASSIPRKKILGIPVLERYKFVPNVASLEVEPSVRVNIQIILENSLVYKVKAVEIVDDYTNKDVPYLTPIVKEVLEDQPMVQSFVKILSKTPLEVTVDVEDKPLKTETDCLVVIASNIFSRPEVLKETFTSLKENGFIISRETSDFNPYSNVQNDINILTVHKTSAETLVLLQKIPTKRQPKYIEIGTTDDFAWVPKVKETITSSFDKEVILYSENDPYNGIIGLVNCMRREPDGAKVKCVFMKDKTKKFRPDDPFFSNQLKKNLAINIYQNGEWGTYRHLLLEEANATKSEHCFVNVGIRGDLSSLTWYEGPLRQGMVKPTETNLIHVYCAALNFRDVMTATGKINADVVTKDRLEQECVQGFEFSGRDEKGKRVMGMVTHNALASLLLADSYLTYDIPDSWSMEDGATIPVVYGTVIYALNIRARIQRGQTILIHSGSGGIGLAAIRLALHYGCKVYTTVGTQAKRDFLKKTFPQLKDRNIGNSHDLSFEQMIYNETKGRGVDLVLNSLAEEKLVASIRCLAEGGKFVEIGKFDMANNNAINLLFFQKNASFHGVMLDQLFTESPIIKAEISNILREGIKYGVIKPLNKTVFKFNEVEQAFRYMATGKHIGKVLVQVRKPEKELITLPPAQQFPCCARYFCDPEKSYVITGGLGGFGLELADWLILRGARKLVLTSRKGLSTGYQKYRIRIWKTYGVFVKISTANITLKSGCKQLLEEASDLGTIDAIFNLAVVLEDAIFENQTPETFATSFGPKALATKHLDELTREMCPKLNAFVIFSSVSCGRGNPGQTNYGMANSVMERICERRKKDGYPALAIEWGAIGEVGLVAEMQEEHTELEISGTLQQQISSCLKVLDGFLRQKDAPIVSSMVVAEKRGGIGTTDNIVDAVINILGLNDSKSVSLHSTLAELGMDSMTAVEIKQTLEREFEVFLSAKDIRTLTLAKLKDIQEEKFGFGQLDDKNTNQVKFGLDLVFRLLGDETTSYVPYIELKTTAEDKTDVPQVLFFPGIEGFANIFEPLSGRMNTRAICVQYQYNNSMKTILDLVEAIMPVVESNISKNKRFIFVSYSFGTLVALEIAHILESRGYSGTIICLDGTPLLMKEFLNQLDMPSDALFQTALLCHLLSFSVSFDVISKNKENLLKCETWEKRMDCASHLIVDLPTYTPEFLKHFASAIYGRLNALRIYCPSYKKLKSNVILYKAMQASVQGLPEDYGMSELVENPLEIKTFEGNHVTILENQKLAETLNEFINK